MTPVNLGSGVLHHGPFGNRLSRTKLELATVRKTNSNRRASSFARSFAVCLHNDLYLARRSRARACSIIDFASFHGQEAARSTENGKVQEFRAGIAAMSANDARLFEFRFSRPEKRSRFSITNIRIGIAIDRWSARANERDQRNIAWSIDRRSRFNERSSRWRYWMLFAKRIKPVSMFA